MMSGDESISNFDPLDDLEQWEEEQVFQDHEGAIEIGVSDTVELEGN